MEFSTQTEGWISIHIIIRMYNFTCAFFYASYAIQNVLIKTQKFTKIQFTSLGYDLGICNTFFIEYITNLVCLSINKQLASFQNLLRRFILVLPRKGLQDVFLISNVSLGNTKLRRGLRVEQAWFVERLLWATYEDSSTYYCPTLKT